MPDLRLTGYLLFFSLFCTVNTYSQPLYTDHFAYMPLPMDSIIKYSDENRIVEIIEKENGKIYKASYFIKNSGRVTRFLFGRLLFLNKPAETFRWSGLDTLYTDSLDIYPDPCMELVWERSFQNEKLQYFKAPPAVNTSNDSVRVLVHHTKNLEIDSVTEYFTVDYGKYGKQKDSVIVKVRRKFTYDKKGRLTKLIHTYTGYVPLAYTIRYIENTEKNRLKIWNRYRKQMNREQHPKKKTPPPCAVE